MIHPLSKSLEILREGSIDMMAGRQLAEVIEAVKEHQGKGSITLTINVAMAAKNSEMVSLSAVVASKKPKEDLTTIAFTDNDNNPVLDKQKGERPSNVSDLRGVK